MKDGPFQIYLQIV